MKAIILNSGRGTRLYPLTRYKPKALVKIGSESILSYQLKSLIACGIKDVIMTTGPFEAQLKRAAKVYPELNIAYVKNPCYKTTNYVYSLWLTKSLIDDDVLLLHGDLIFEKKPLSKLISSKNQNCVLVNKNVSPPSKDFSARISNERVIQIGVGLTGDNTHFLAPMYKFCEADFKLWLDNIENSIRAGDTQIYAENVFNKIAEQIFLAPEYFVEEYCLEIDDVEDLSRAKHIINHSQTSKR